MEAAHIFIFRHPISQRRRWKTRSSYYYPMLLWSKQPLSKGPTCRTFGLGRLGDHRRRNGWMHRYAE